VAAVGHFRFLKSMPPISAAAGLIVSFQGVVVPAMVAVSLSDTPSATCFAMLL